MLIFKQNGPRIRLINSPRDRNTKSASTHVVIQSNEKREGSINNLHLSTPIARQLTQYTATIHSSRPTTDFGAFQNVYNFCNFSTLLGILKVFRKCKIYWRSLLYTFGWRVFGINTRTVICILYNNNNNIDMTSYYCRIRVNARGKKYDVLFII